MNIKGDVTTDWADGTYTFRLTLSGAIELEDKCQAPIAVVSDRIFTGRYSVTDVRETIRLGLIGGGTKPEQALKLVRSYVDERPLAESAVMARIIVGGLMYGFEAAKIPNPPEASADQSPNGSTPPQSTPPSPSSPMDDPLMIWGYGSITR